MKRPSARRAAAPPISARDIDAYLAELTPDALEQLEAWEEAEQALFHELLEDAGSELQRELLGRALAAGHDVKALHAFSDALRPLSDEAAFEACTLSDTGAASARTVVARLRAEADPLFAFEANGHVKASAAAADDDDEEDSVIARRRSIPASLLAPVEPPRYARPPRPSFEEESRTTLPRASRDTDDEHSRASATAGTGRPYATELYTEATRGLGLTYREEAVDSPRLPLEKALERVVEALQRNVLVPAVIGPEVGDLRRDVLFLQVQPAGKGRSFQLHDPAAGETVWAHERDLLARLELPFTDKRNRRITAVSLPSASPRA